MNKFNVGDVVELVYNGILDTTCEGEIDVIREDGKHPYRGDNLGHQFRIISSAKADKYGPWQLATPTTPTTDDMQVSRGPDGEIVAYRVKVEPKVKEYETFFHIDKFGGLMVGGYTNVDTHKITFNTIDGEPDCSSIKMEKL